MANTEMNPGKVAHKLPSLNYVRAEAIWEGETCFIIAGGPSLVGFDFARLTGRRVIAINSSVFSYPEADVLFFGDERWWGWNSQNIISGYKGRIFTTGNISHPKVMNLVRRRPPPFISTERGEVTMHRTSLTAAMNLAVHFGVKIIVLLGVDQKPATNGRTHHHDPHPIASVPGCWDVQMKELKLVASSISESGVEVINTSMESRIDFWRKQPIEELLQ